MSQIYLNLFCSEDKSKIKLQSKIMIQSCLNESGGRLKNGGTYFKVTGINLIYHDFVVVMHFGSATIGFLSYEVS